MQDRLNQNDVTNRVDVEDPARVRDAVMSLPRSLQAEVTARLAIPPPRPDAELQASVLFLAAAQNNQVAKDNEPGRDGKPVSLLTAAIQHVWDNGAFRGSYWQFVRELALRMPPWQSPGLEPRGRADRAFATARPFTVD